MPIEGRIERRRIRPNIGADVVRGQDVVKRLQFIEPAVIYCWLSLLLPMAKPFSARCCWGIA